MVAGLAFLSKKSWHTKNISNQERVWVAEQRKEQEEAKAKELAKQIAQEREQEEMDKIAGKKSARIDRGIDWMYHGQEKNSEIAQQDAAKKSEEYLLGKAYVTEGQAVGDFDASSNLKEGVNAVVEAKKPPPQQESAAYKEPSVADRNEAFRMRHEDPMFAVAMEAKHKQDEYRKKKELYERVVGVKDESDDDDEKKDRKRHRKDKKYKKKKKHRKRHRHYSSDEESSVGDRRRHHRKRHKRSRTPDSHEDDRHQNSDSRKSRDREEYSARHGDRGDRHHHRRRRDDYSDDDSYDRRGRHRGRYDRHRSRSPAYSRGREEKRSYDSDPRDDPTRHDSYARGGESSAKDFSHERKPGYGLQGKSSLKSPPTDLGPDRDLLRKKRQELEEQKERNRNQSARSNMTAEEREAALREMEESARQYQSRREQRPDKEDEVRHDAESSAAFLQSAARKVHGVSDASMSLQERISQKRSTNQRLHEDFM